MELKKDLEAIVSAMQSGGKAAAAAEYDKICAREGLKTWEAAVLRDKALAAMSGIPVSQLVPPRSRHD
jgi:hypothetical protein